MGNYMVNTTMSPRSESNWTLAVFPAKVVQSPTVGVVVVGDQN